MRYDLHIHTKYSPCSSLKAEVALSMAKKRKLDGIAITDHNTIEGSRKVARLNKDKDFEVIMASELSTQYGDVLVYYVQEEIKGEDFFTVLDSAKEQDAIVSIAHPSRPFGYGFKHSIKDISGKIDALECINGRTFGWENRKVEKIAEKLKIAKTAGADAHFGFEIGRAVTVFDDDLRCAIKKKATKVEGDSLANPMGIAMSFVKKRILW